MAVKIRLKRLGKIRAPYYRIVVADSRTKRDGRAIEEIGKYHPTHDPSVIDVNSDRAQYWLGVGAQPTEQVLAILKITGDWQKFKGLPGAEGTLKVAEARVEDRSGFDEAKSLNQNEAKTLRSRKKAEPEKKAEAKAEAKAEPENTATPTEPAVDDSSAPAPAQDSPAAAGESVDTQA